MEGGRRKVGKRRRREGKGRGRREREGRKEGGSNEWEGIRLNESSERSEEMNEEEVKGKLKGK